MTIKSYHISGWNSSRFDNKSENYRTILFENSSIFKNTKTQNTYVGLITPNGVVYSDKKKVTLSNIEVREYGFSHALWELCPQDWKKPLGKDWEDVLSIIITRNSPESYLKDRVLRKEEADLHYQFQAQAASLGRRIFNKYGIGFQELEILKTIYLVRIEKNNAISVVSPEQQELIERLGLKLGD